MRSPTPSVTVETFLPERDTPLLHTAVPIRLDLGIAHRAASMSFVQIGVFLGKELLLLLLEISSQKFPHAENDLREAITPARYDEGTPTCKP